VSKNSAIDHRENKDLSTLPKHSLAFDQDTFEGIFQLLEKHDVEDLWMLIHAIRANPHIFFELLALESKASLQKHLAEDSSMYRKFYSLKIIAHLFHEYLSTEEEKVIIFYNESKNTTQPQNEEKNPPKLDLHAVNQDANNQQTGGTVPLPPNGQQVYGAKCEDNNSNEAFLGPLAPPVSNQMSEDQLKDLKASSQRTKEISLDKPILSDADLQWAAENGIVDKKLAEKSVKQLKKEWMLKFIEVNGLSVLVDTLRDSNEKN